MRARRIPINGRSSVRLARKKSLNIFPKKLDRNLISYALHHKWRHGHAAEITDIIVTEVIIIWKTL